jgi:2-succinyl-5-enolpyruvyl-6-hydroxy-3-cyclohexene-1-carboxylate synthase
MTVAAYDDLLRHERFAADHTPTVVLRLGRPPASKVLAQWLAASGARQVQVGGAEGVQIAGCGDTKITCGRTGCANGRDLQFGA